MSVENFFDEANRIMASHAAAQSPISDDAPRVEPSKPATTKPTKATRATRPPHVPPCDQGATVTSDRIAISLLAGIDPDATVKDCVCMIRLLATLTPENLQDPKARHGLLTILNLLDRQLITLKVNPS